MSSHNNHHLTWVTYVLLTYLSNPTSKERRLCGPRRAERTYSTFKVRRGGMRRYPSSKVRNSGCALLEQP